MMKSVLALMFLFFSGITKSQDSTIYKALDSLDFKKMELNMSKVKYGKGCGMVGNDPDARILMEELIHKADTSALNLWLSADILEMRAYAVEAFYHIQSSGVHYQKSN